MLHPECSALPPCNSDQLREQRWHACLASLLSPHTSLVQSACLLSTIVSFAVFGARRANSESALFCALCNMQILELFSGSGSIGKVFTQKGWSVTSLELDPKIDATIHENILTWDFTTYPPVFVQVVLASPCCTQYSCARRGAKTPRNLDLADSLVKRSFEIIEYFQP